MWRVSTLLTCAAPLHVEREIEICAGLIDAAHIDHKLPYTGSTKKICLDEWNIWNIPRAPGQLGAEEK